MWRAASGFHESYGANPVDPVNPVQTFSGLKILIVDAGVIEKSIDLGSRYGLLTTDAIHLSTIKQYGINNIATNDSDFERVESITSYKPERSMV